jgi:hypothetical protein
MSLVGAVSAYGLSSLSLGWSVLPRNQGMLTELRKVKLNISFPFVPSSSAASVSRLFG